MMTIIMWIAVIPFIIVVFLFINIVAGWLHFKYFRKCPRCHNKMEYQYKIVDKDGSTDGYVFYCPYCRTFEKVTTVEMIREEYGTK